MSASLRKHMPLDSSSESEEECEADKGRHVPGKPGSNSPSRARQSPMLMQHWAGIDDGHVRMWQEDEEEDEEDGLHEQGPLGHSQPAQHALDESIDTDSLGGSFDSVSAEALLAARTRPITAAINTLRAATNVGGKGSARKNGSEVGGSKVGWDAVVSRVASGVI